MTKWRGAHNALIAEADAFLSSAGAVDPARLTAAMLPGIELAEG